MRLGEVDADFRRKWDQLESQTVEGNAFLSPGFVLSATQNLALESEPFLLAIERHTPSAPELVGLLVVEESSGSTLLPLKHLQSWRCDHSFTDGLLLSEKYADEGAETLFHSLNLQSCWHGLAFTNRTRGTTLDRILCEAAARVDSGWQEDWYSERACIPANEVPADCLGTLYSKSRRKTIRKNLKKLEGFGEVRFEIHNSDLDGQLLDKFLSLEASGWKGLEGTALGCEKNHTSFCRDWVKALENAERLTIAELSAGQRTIAMSLNPLSGNRLFAFKIGWDSEFAACSPGTLCEYMLMQSLKEKLPEISIVDSCSKPDSYVEGIWPWKLGLTSGVFPTSGVGRLAVSSMSRLKQLKRLLSRANG